MPSPSLSRRHLVLAAAGAGLSCWSAHLQAQDTYPAKPVQVLVGFPGGGALDVAMRVVINALAHEGVAPMVSLNRPGASATIAATQAARAAPDGYTLLLATSANMGIAPHLYPRLPYDSRKDFSPVAQFAVGQNVVYASQASGIRSLAELRERLRAQPGRLSYASPGAGTTAHLTFEMFKAREKMFIVHVPFRGSPAAIGSVVAGELDVGVDAIGPTQAFIRSGRIVPLVQTGATRSSLLPEVPTFAELGLANMPSGTYLGLSAPQQTPEPVLTTLRRALQRVLAKPEASQQLAAAGFEARFVDGPAFAEMMAADSQQWRQAVQYSGATGS